MPTLTQLRRWMALPGVKHLIPQKKGWTKAEVIEELQKLAKRLKKTPTKNDINAQAPFSTIVLTRLFGSVNKGLRATGLRLNNFIGYTKADCVRELRRVARLRNQQTLTGAEFTRYASFSRTVVLTKLGTWNNALRLAGLGVPHFIGYTTEDCIKELKRVHRLLGHAPTISDFEQHAHFCWYVVFRRFGSWNKGLKSAGMKINQRTPRTYLLYRQVQQLAQKARITTKAEFYAWERPRGVPSSPYEVYKNSGWVNWNIFLGTRERFNHLSYKQVQILVQKAGIETGRQFRAWHKPLGVPSNPNKIYKGWKNWKEFFGTGTTDFVTYEVARKLVHKARVTTWKEFYAWERPRGVPSAPNRIYKNKGWKNWYSFLGKSR